MRKHLFLILMTLLLALAGCDDFEGGDPPVLGGDTPGQPGFSVTAISNSQIVVSWEPAEDDFLNASELVYGIWYSTGGVDPETAPNVITDEGARAYCLNDLDANETYDILVRATERGNTNSWSVNTTTQQATTDATTWRDVQMFQADDASGFVAGKVFSSERDTVGVIQRNEIRWLSGDANGDVTFLEDRRFSASANIREAHLVNITGTLDDLLILTNNGVQWIENEEDAEGDVFSGGFSLNGAIEGGLSLVQDDDEVILAFMGGDGVVQIYLLDESEGFVSRGSYSFGDTGADIHLEDLNSDGRFDLTAYTNSGLRIAFGADSSTDESFDFENDTQIQDDDDPLSDALRWFHAGSSGITDDLTDSFVFWRNESEDQTILWFYSGHSSNGYNSKSADVDYEGAFFGNPHFVDLDGDNRLDILFAQDASNTIAIARGASSADSSFEVSNQDGYIGGGSGNVSLVTTADIGGNGRLDVIMLSDTGEISVLVSQEAVAQ